MDAHELRKRKADELRALLVEQRQRLRDLQFRLSGAQLKNSNELRETKKTIARILTILNNPQNE